MWCLLVLGQLQTGALSGCAKPACCQSVAALAPALELCAWAHGYSAQAAPSPCMWGSTMAWLHGPSAAAVACLLQTSERASEAFDEAHEPWKSEGYDKSQQDKTQTQDDTPPVGVGAGCRAGPWGACSRLISWAGSLHTAVTHRLCCCQHRVAANALLQRQAVNESTATLL